MSDVAPTPTPADALAAVQRARQTVADTSNLVAIVRDLLPLVDLLPLIEQALSEQVTPMNPTTPRLMMDLALLGVERELLTEQLVAVTADNTRYRAALEVYANTNNWSGIGDDDTWEDWWMPTREHGYTRAQQALEGAPE